MNGVFGVLLAIAMFASGCGYTWQGTTNRWTAEKVDKIYVKMLVNNTLRPGIEVAFTSAILKTFARGQRIKLVSNENNADAVIDGTVTSLDSVANAPAPVTSITQDPAA